jgi:hypothetical protein
MLAYNTATIALGLLSLAQAPGAPEAKQSPIVGTWHTVWPAGEQVWITYGPDGSYRFQMQLAGREVSPINGTYRYQDGVLQVVTPHTRRIQKAGQPPMIVPERFRVEWPNANRMVIIDRKARYTYDRVPPKK